MSTLKINPFEYFTDTNGDPLDAGYIYVGGVNLDPETNPIGVYYDAALTIPVSQPIRTVNGYILNAGSPASLFVDGNYSIRVRNKNLVQIYYIPDFLSFGLRSPLAGGDGSASVGFIQSGSGALARTSQDKMRERISLKDYGAIGDGTLHTLGSIYTNLSSAQAVYPLATALTQSVDFVAFQAAITYCNSKQNNNLVSTLIDSGATLVIDDGVYDMTGIASTVYIQCNLQCGAAEFMIPASYNGEVLRVGKDTANISMIGIRVEVPAIYKPNGSNFAGVGSVAVRLANLYMSEIKFTGRINYFQELIVVGGVNAGNAYNRIYLNQLAYGQTLLKLTCGVGGWSNDNWYFGGQLNMQSLNGWDRNTGYYQIYIDGTNSTIASNNFYVSAEGAGADYLVYINQGANNKFYGHHEGGQFNSPKTFTISGSTLTDTSASGSTLVVGDMIQVIYLTGNLPANMFLTTNYYVRSVAGNTFTVSPDQTGAAVVFSASSGTYAYSLIQRVRFTGNRCYDNTFVDWFVPSSDGMQMIQDTGAFGNTWRRTNTHTCLQNVPADHPLYKGQNLATSARRPIFATYENNIDVDQNPSLWSNALSPKGLLFNDSTGAQSGLISENGTFGILNYTNFKDGRGQVYEVRYGLSAINATLTGTVPANDRLLVTQTYTGTATGDQLTVTPTGTMQAGLIVGWARISGTNTATVAIHNLTASPISLSQGFKFTALVTV